MRLKQRLSWPPAAPLLAAAVATLYLLSIAILHVNSSATEVVRAYGSERPLQPGLIVALKDEEAKIVEPSPGNEPEKMFGVVVDPSEVPLTVTQNGRKIYVATSGLFKGLVSVENGEIKKGDYLSMSFTDGVAAKARDSQLVVIGKAAAGYNGNDRVTKTSDGTAIGLVPIEVAVGKNPNAKTDIAAAEPLRRAAESIAGKPISVTKLYSAGGLLLATVIVAVILLWVGVRSSVISIGRNPLSKKTILRGLAQLILAALAIFIIGVFGVYLLLKL